MGSMRESEIRAVNGKITPGGRSRNDLRRGLLIRSNHPTGGGPDERTKTGWVTSSRVSDLTRDPGGPRGTRTLNQWVKSPLLCH